MDLWEINPVKLISYLFDEIIKFVGRGSSADVVRLFKAFVVVPHSILIKKLEYYKVTYCVSNGLKTG